MLAFLQFCLSQGAFAEDALDRRITLDIPANTELEDALIKWGVTTGVTVMINTKVVEHCTTHALQGELSARKALTLLLHECGLSYSEEGGRIRIAPIAGVVHSTDRYVELADLRAGTLSDGAQGTLPSDHTSTPASEKRGNSSVSGQDLSEVVVTAEKHEERLQDVPVPVTAISAESLSANNQLRLQDYYSQIPGFNVAPLSSGPSQLLSIRGVTMGVGGNPTVGITVDDVPFGSSTSLGGGGAVPDIDPSDLQRVEVLRGPQGTLYGASSMGGLLKFVTADPSTDKFSARLEGSGSSVYNGAELGYGARAAVNLPLSDSFAVRASAFTREDPGYIDNPVLHIDGVNEQHVSGGRLSSLWRPSDDVSLKLSAVYQDYKGDGVNDVDILPGLGDLQQNYIFGAGAYEKKLQAYSATFSAKLGAVTLTSVTGYSINEYFQSFDFSQELGSLNSTVGLPGSGSILRESNRTNKVTQELRFSWSVGSLADFLVGGFYTHENSAFDDTFLAIDTTTNQNVGEALDTQFPTTYREYAGFGDVTFHVTDRFDIQVGGRESRIEQSVTETNIGPFDEVFFLQSSPVIYPKVATENDAFTYLVTPRFKITPDLMVYARLASGYRPGGPNAAPGEPLQYDPDKTENYELGAKGSFLDNKLSLDGSVYYIDWKNIQVSLTDPVSGYAYTANGNRAKSQGVELSSELKPLRGLTIGAWVVFSDAQLTAAFPAASGIDAGPGSPLPYGERFSTNVSVQDEFPLGAELAGYCGVNTSYVGLRQGEFSTGATGRAQYPAYAKTDLSAGLHYLSWNVSLYANNVADRRAALTGGPGSIFSYAYTYIQPRTVGISLVKTF